MLIRFRFSSHCTIAVKANYERLLGRLLHIGYHGTHAPLDCRESEVIGDFADLGGLDIHAIKGLMARMHRLGDKNSGQTVDEMVSRDVALLSMVIFWKARESVIAHYFSRLTLIVLLIARLSVTWNGPPNTRPPFGTGLSSAVSRWGAVGRPALDLSGSGGGLCMCLGSLTTRAD